MLELNAFFDGMSKPLLRDVHAKAYGKKGLLNNTLIQTEVLAFFCDRKRAVSIFDHLEPWQRRCINLVYHSGSRGLSLNELRLTVPVTKARDLQRFLLSMCREFVMWRSFVSGNAVYYGFQNFIGCFEIEAETLEELPKASLEYGNLLDWHLCQVLSLAMRGELKINTNNLLHRRSRQLCTSAFVLASQVSEKASDNELVLIFNFLTQNGWLEMDQASIFPSETAFEFLRKNGFRLHQDILSWWIGVRFRKDREHLSQLLSYLRTPKSVIDASFLFWVMDPSYRIMDRNKLLVWEYLPRHLRELWLLGLVKFHVVSEKGMRKVAAVSLTDAGAQWLETSVMPVPEPSISALPNFDLIASTGTSPRVLFALACLAQVKNDETFLCFNLNKESYLAGLRCGIPESEMDLFRSWINPPENVGMTLDEWNASFYGARVRTVRLLKIDDLNILTELSHFAQFVECTEEFIAGYGFVLNPDLERRAFDILENFGYCPFAGKKNIQREPAPTEEWRKEFVIAWPTASKPDFDLKDDVDEASIQTTMNATKYGSLYQKLDTFDLVKVLRYAKMAGTLLAAQVKDPAKRAEKQHEIVFFVHSLHLAKSPFNVEIQEHDAEAKYSLPLAFIQEVKVLHKTAL